MSDHLAVERKSLPINGASLTYFERTGEAVRPLVLVHATGLHARVWDAITRRVAPEFRVLALDMRGHGRSEKTGPFNWAQFGRDVSEFCTRLELEDIVAVGHSMGGHSIVLACLSAPSLIRSLVLIDPVIRDPSDTAEHRTAMEKWAAGDHPVARRRDQWSSPDEMFNHYRTRFPFEQWQPEVLWSYCRFGLSECEGAQLRLACPPLVEAEIYLGAGNDPDPSLLRQLRQPVTVMRATERDSNWSRFDFSKSPTWPELARQFPNGKDVYLPGLTHFIPMERPDLVAEYINAQVDV
ncbi:MAG: alpha/beta hydrolase [Pseudomonadales bacterium]|nr:alpha/beta hydrolase [Pseudomonadales bacterium]